MTGTDLSVVIPTQNNAQTLAATLSSVAFADEVIVLDSGSTDGTVDIANAAGAHVLHRHYVNDGDQRNAGWDAATCRWVLALDSDETLDEEAIAGIRRIAAREPGPGEPLAYGIRRRNYFLGQPLMHGERDIIWRLALRSRSRWQPILHAQLIVEGSMGMLPGLVHHPSCVSLYSRLNKIGRYAVDRAEKWRAQGVKPSLWRACWQPLRYYFGRVVIRKGFRDGLPGLVWWWLMATEILLSHFLLAYPEALATSANTTHSGTPPSRAT